MKPNHAIAEKTGVRLQDFRLILVRPKFAGNIGACARLAANFGIDDFCVVSPECAPDWRSSEQVQAFATGKSNELLLSAREYSSLEEALSPCTRALAFTRRPRDKHPLDLLFSEVLLPPGKKASSHFQQEWPTANEKIALVFGNEKTGLLDIEIQLCSHCVRIATSDELGSMNLSHAVAVVLARLYERAELALSLTRSGVPEPRTDAVDRFGTLDELTGLWAHWREALQHLGFNQAGNPDRMISSLRALLAPLQWKHRDIQLVRGILTRIIRKSTS